MLLGGEVKAKNEVRDKGMWVCGYVCCLNHLCKPMIRIKFLDFNKI